MIYETKNPDEVSWTQDVPKTSLDFIYSFGLSKTARIIDIGGGDSKLVDFLLEEGFEDLTVLDISEKALERSRKRLGDKARKVKWIVSDVTEFRPITSYDCWHDRAAFHFLTSSRDIDAYLNIARKAVNKFMIIGTFSDKGPKKCSMLDVHQYDEDELKHQFQKGFEKLKCVTEDHMTPFNTKQNFLFCAFKRRSSSDGSAG